MLMTELLVLIIGAIVFLVQSRFKETVSKISNKLVYWTILFFISLFFNSILFRAYNTWYSIYTYLNFNTIIIILGVFITYVLVQAISPFEYIKNMFKRFSIMKNKDDELGSMLEIKEDLEPKSSVNLDNSVKLKIDGELKEFVELDEEIEKNSLKANEKSVETKEDVIIKEAKEINEENKNRINYTKQLHFEAFLETICWIGFISAVSLEGYMALLSDIKINKILEENIIMVVCLTLMITVPITLRQIIFYLFRIRDIKEEVLTDEELKLQRKLNKENIRL